MSAVRVCSVADVKPGEALRVEVEGHRVAVVRVGDEFYALGDRCSHADVSLSEGEVDEGRRTVECWLHGSTFDLATGRPLSLPATKPVPVYEVVVDGDDVKVVVVR